ncbi:hypothetical protein CR513_35354, partial [Mucuna pruriens]
MFCGAKGFMIEESLYIFLIINEYFSSFAYLVDLYVMWHDRLRHINFSYDIQIYIYPIKHKNKAFDMFLTYKVEVENQLNMTIKRIKSNKGGGYILFNNFCENERIIHEVTLPYSLESNGVHERKNIKKMINVMLVSSSTFNNLLGEGMLTTCFLKNRIPRKRIKKTPYDLWKNNQPNLLFFESWANNETLSKNPRMISRQLIETLNEIIYEDLRESKNMKKTHVLKMIFTPT